MTGIRVDKYLWAVRLAKTRSQSAEAVKTGQVLVNQTPIKPAHEVKKGDVLSVKRNPIWRSYKVIEVLSSRVGAKLVATYIEECTTAGELQKLEMMKLMPGYDREKGTGRPTKKERRELDDLGW